MIYVFNKNKIISYLMACAFVLMLFSFKKDTMPNKDVELVKVSSNAIESNNNLNNTNDMNNIKNNN